MDYESRDTAMIFGIYPGGVSGAADGTMAVGSPDNGQHIKSCLDLLRGNASTLLLRAYCIFDDERGACATDTTAPMDADQFATVVTPLDVVAQFQSRSSDITGYVEFVRNVVDRYGPVANSIQITEEPNVQGNPTLDGHYAGVIEAMIAGVGAARSRADELGLGRLRIGINTTPLFGDDVGFLKSVTESGGRRFVESLDYIGLDMFPGVFSQVAFDDLRPAVAGLLRHHRTNVMEPVGLGHLPLRITENGWPSGTRDSPQIDAAALGSIIDTVVHLEEELLIEAYELFSLRDADSSNPDVFHRFGIVTDDYRPKPAFDVYRQIIAACDT